MPEHDSFEASKALLRAIAEASYNDTIRPVAQEAWDKQLTANNPQWKYIKLKVFSAEKEHNKAHAIAMTDKRLPGIGLVGYFACTDLQTGAEVLTRAAEWLKTKHGLAHVYGPINGTLPNDYRLNLHDDYVFPGEPVNPIWYIDAFKLAGFKVFNRYVSGISKSYLMLLKLASRAPKKGYEHIRVRPFDPKSESRDFRIYHELRNNIFPLQSLYCPAISLKERIFNTGNKFDPKYTYFLTDGDKEVGFAMAYPFEDKLIFKTIGILPKYRGKRLKGLLLKPIREQAEKDGLKACVFAMVRVGNPIYRSRNLGVRVFRRYVTMHKITD